MKKIRHILLVISEEPINAWDIEKQGGVHHFINEQVELIPGCDGDNLIIEKALPAQTMENCRCVYRGMGIITPLAIVDFLRSVFGSASYESLRSRKRREKEEAEKRQRLLNVFGDLVYSATSQFSPSFEFRFPKISEKVFVQHGFARCGFGTVKSMHPNSDDEKVIITIHGEKDFDVPYTFNEKSAHWECATGNHKIDSGTSIAIYSGDENEIDPNKFTFIYPPTDWAREYWNKSRKNA